MSEKFKDNSELCKLAIKKAEEKWLVACGELLTSAIRPLIPVYTSNLKTSLDYKVDLENMTLYVGVNEEYAIYVEFGTGIYAENGQGRKGGWCYKDPVTGDVIFTYGSSPKPFMRPAYRANKKKIQELLKKYMGEVK